MDERRTVGGIIWAGASEYIIANNYCIVKYLCSLFPAEDTEGDEVDDDEPGGHDAELRGELGDGIAFVDDVAQAIDDRR